MFKVIKVKGKSLYPQYRDGDFVILAKFPVFLQRIMPGDTVIFRDDLYGQMIKRVDKIDRQSHKLYVLGDHEDSLDSRQLGWVDYKNVMGKVVHHIRQENLLA